MAIERYIETILSGIAPLPLVLSRSDIARVVSARFGIKTGYAELPEFANGDFLYFSGSKESIGVEEVRTLISRIHFVTGTGTTRIVVIDRFDLMTEQSANAMLKTLEDGIPGVVFLLQAESFVGLLETIVSRVVCVSSDTSSFNVRDADLEFARGVIALRPEALKQFIGARWTNRSDGLVFIEATERLLREKGIGGPIHERLLEAYRGIANTNALPKYVLDGILMDLTRLAGKRE